MIFRGLNLSLRQDLKFLILKIQTTMQKHLFKTKAETILPAGEHDAIVDGSDVYVKISSTSPVDGEGEKSKTAAPTKAAAPVKDDTKPATKAPAPTKAPAKAAAPAAAPASKAVAPRKAPAAPAPVEEPASDEPVEITDWATVTTDDTVYVQLAGLDGMQEDGVTPLSEKLWEATIIGWEKPKGARQEALKVAFVEDGSEDYLRDGDRMFEYTVPV